MSALSWPTVSFGFGTRHIEEVVLQLSAPIDNRLLDTVLKNDLVLPDLPAKILFENICL